MTITTSLKRLFLNSTDLTSEGAIAFAEFLPEARSLLHLDLTSNQIDISGVLALAVSVKLNSTIRCLDINIPPNDPDFSRLSQDILETCVRNTEFAQAEADGKGRKVTIAQPIMKSALVLNLEERQKAEELESQKRKDMTEQGRTMFAAAEETRDVVRELLEVDRQAAQRGVIVAPSEVVRDALVQLQLAEAQLAEAFDATRQGEQRGAQLVCFPLTRIKTDLSCSIAERAEMLLIELASLLDLAKEVYDRPPPPVRRANGAQRPPNLEIPLPAVPAEEQPSSPSFSITSTDSEDSDKPPEAQSTELSSPPVAEASSKPELSTLSIHSPDSSPPASPSGSHRSPIESSSRSMTLEEGEIFRKGLALGATEVPDDDDEDEQSGTVSAAQGNGTGIGLGLGAVSGEDLKNEVSLRSHPDVNTSSDTDPHSLCTAPRS